VADSVADSVEVFQSVDTVAVFQSADLVAVMVVVHRWAAALVVWLLMVVVWAVDTVLERPSVVDSAVDSRVFVL
jgi:hypothetical protein